MSNVYIALASIAFYIFCAGIAKSFLNKLRYEDMIVTAGVWPALLVYSMFKGLLDLGIALGTKLQANKSKDSYKATIKKR